MKENGIGRPSTRAAIIETLFRRKYISKNKKRLEATNTGRQLIGSIKNEILKSVELTGQWERKLKLIEKGEFSVDEFKVEMKNMVAMLTDEVKRDFSPRIVDLEDAPVKKKVASNDNIECPKCKNGHLIKGKKAYGCSEFRNNCDFTIPFSLMDKKLSENQIKTLANKGKTALIKGFKQGDEKINGHLYLSESFNIEFEQKLDEKNKCPMCSSTEFIKGKNAFGCANYKNGCKFVIPFNIAGTDDLAKLKIDKKLLNKLNVE